MTNLTIKKIWHPVLFFATGFGSGLLPKIPGTFGTLAAIPIYLCIAKIPIVTYFIVISVLFLLGIPLTGRASFLLGKHDDARIVFDEIVGFLLTMAFVPLQWYWVFWGFLLFRFFDILKPYPISCVDARVSSGLGIMLDDVLAAFPACLLLNLLVWMTGS